VGNSDIRVEEAMAPDPDGVRQLPSSILSARSAAARERPCLATNRTRPSQSPNLARARTGPPGIENEQI
jgi:hypothetical protein